MRLSIIIPVYNAEKYLEACLLSCLAQKNLKIGVDYEIICVNDGSTDNSKAILDKYERGGKIIAINQSNAGVSKARNNGLKRANGKYVWFVDSDDVIEPNCIRAILDELYHEKAIGCTFNVNFVPEHFRISNIDAKCELTFRTESYSYGGNMPFNIIINREFLLVNQIEFNPAMSFGEDTLWRYYIWLYSDYVLQTDTVLYHYRNVPTSATHAKSEIRSKKWLTSMQEMLYSYQHMYDNFPNDINKRKRYDTKIRIYWTVQNILLGAIRAKKSREVLSDLIARGLYPYPVLWKRLWGSRSLGEFGTNLFCLLFPIPLYYKNIAKIYSRFL